MTRVKVSELKNNLSRYLAAARRGETIVVCDRSTPIARIVPYKEEDDGWGDDFVVIPAEGSPADLNDIVPVKLLKDVDAVALIIEGREDRI
jgi:prevent-host-death family protein